VNIHIIFFFHQKAGGFGFLWGKISKFKRERE